MKKSIYILYNADSSIAGKLRYGYRKLQRSADAQPACAACDITHGGFSLNESAGWKSAKGQIEQETGAKVVQLHRNEIASNLKNWTVSTGTKYPAVVLGKKNGDDESFELMLGRDELWACNGDANALAQKLKESKVIREQASL